jgi:chromosome segregation ATPase
MKLFRTCSALIWFAVAATGFGQNQEPDPQGLKEILAEIRAIHADIRVTETTQILLTELEMQQSVVNRATESFDNARTRLVDIQRDQKLEATELQRAEDHQNEASTDDERKHFAEEIERHKSNLAALKIEDRERTATLQQMEDRLQTAQDALDKIQNELNGIISRMRPADK